MKHLRYCLRSAYELGYPQHAQQVMQELGITYQHATPQSIADQWWFWNCENMQEPLPGFLSVLEITDPYKYIGFGLSKEAADKIANYNNLTK